MVLVFVFVVNVPYGVYDKLILVVYVQLNPGVNIGFIGDKGQAAAGMITKRKGNWLAYQWRGNAAEDSLGSQKLWWYDDVDGTYAAESPKKATHDRLCGDIQASQVLVFGFELQAKWDYTFDPWVLKRVLTHEDVGKDL